MKTSVIGICQENKAKLADPLLQPKQFQAINLLV